MTQFHGELAIYDVSSILVTGIGDALVATVGGPVPRACVVPGAVAWDECDCGTLLVSPQRFFISDEFPEGALGRGLVRTSPCDSPWLVNEIVIQVIRCSPSPLDGQLSVACDRLNDAARILMVDAYVTLTTSITILCGLREDERIIDYVIGEQVTRGPEGGCVGTELNVFVSLLR